MVHDLRSPGSSPASARADASPSEVSRRHSGTVRSGADPTCGEVRRELPVDVAQPNWLIETEGA